MHDVTPREILLVFTACAVPGIIAYLLARFLAGWRLGLALALLWIPGLSLVCAASARATIIGWYLCVLLPILVCFAWGRFRRALAAEIRGA
jgi:uncharacterized membrane protein